MTAQVQVEEQEQEQEQEQAQDQPSKDQDSDKQLDEQRCIKVEEQLRIISIGEDQSEKQRGSQPDTAESEFFSDDLLTGLEVREGTVEIDGTVKKIRYLPMPSDIIEQFFDIVNVEQYKDDKAQGQAAFKMLLGIVKDSIVGSDGELLFKTRKVPMDYVQVLASAVTGGLLGEQEKKTTT